MLFNLIPQYTWLPWYLELLIVFPIALFIIIAIFRFIMALVDIVVKVKGIFIR